MTLPKSNKTKSTNKLSDKPKKTAAKPALKNATKKPLKATSKKSTSTLTESIELSTLTSAERLHSLLAEADKELNALQPQLDALEEPIQRYQALRHEKQKLLSLKLSLQAILQQFSQQAEPTKELENSFNASTRMMLAERDSVLSTLKVDAILEQQQTFQPDQALLIAQQRLKRPGSLNYELYRAVVLQGGQASTEQVKAYLVREDIRQPGNQESFEAIPLTDISARVGYLVRKGLLKALGNGRFRCMDGWR